MSPADDEVWLDDYDFKEHKMMLGKVGSMQWWLNPWRYVTKDDIYEGAQQGIMS